MCPSYEDKSPRGSVYRVLRGLNSFAGLCAIILNTITLAIEQAGKHGEMVTRITSTAYVPIILSLVWNHLNTYALSKLPKGHNWVAMLVDAGISLGFLALIIVNAILVSGLQYIGASRVILLTYNTMPWIICE